MQYENSIVRFELVHTLYTLIFNVSHKAWAIFVIYCVVRNVILFFM